MLQTALDKIKEIYIEESKLAQFLGVTSDRIRDMRSNHNTGRKEFIPFISPTSKCHLYHVDDVLEFLNSTNKVIFDLKEK